MTHSWLRLQDMLHCLGIHGEPLVQPVEGGANNRAFRVEAGGQKLFLKVYFQHPSDPRDRLDAEFAFSEFAWRLGCRALPMPIAADRSQHLGLYEFVAGARPARDGIASEHVQQAARFFAALNARPPTESGLKPASEACFSLEDHVALINARIERLASAARVSDDWDFTSFVRMELAPAAREIVADVERLSASRRAWRVPPSDWCVSPSDFGFHNALLGPDGRLRFVDFEYAGLDEPARMICDFFCQVQVPVPDAEMGAFCRTALEPFDSIALHLDRMATLLPLYRLKWCCIVLNEFLPTDAARRRFAQARGSQEVRKASQLAKARAMLNRLPQPARA